jgi:hypothetical protein
MKSSHLSLPALAMLALCGCQSGGKPGTAGGIVIGMEVVPHQNQTIAMAITGFDKAHNKADGIWSSSRISFERGNLFGPSRCKDDVCYFQSTAAAGDYVLYMLSIQADPSFGGALTGQRATSKRDMSKGTFFFHVSPGKFTYGGTYVVHADLSGVTGTPFQPDHPGSHIGEHGESEPTITYRMDLAATEAAIKDFKGFPTELVPSEPSATTFAP